MSDTLRKREMAARAAVEARQRAIKNQGYVERTRDMWRHGETER